MRRVWEVAVALAAVLILTAGVLAAESAQYVGSKTCAVCHSQQYKDWQSSLHSKMVQDPKVPGAIVGDFSTNEKFKPEDVLYTVGVRTQYYVARQGNDIVYLPLGYNTETRQWVPRSGSWLNACASCHTTGYNKETKTWAELGIACEACHGPGSLHASSGDKTKIISSPSNDLCASCHGGERQVGQMAESGKHLNIFKEQIEKSDHYSDSCLKCHSATYILAPENAKPTLADFKTGALKGDRYGITCVVCHDPHKRAEEAQLRKSPQETCTQCHTAEEGPVPRHTQKQIAEGIWGKDVPVTPSPKVAKCVDCHMSQGNHMDFKVGTPTFKMMSHGKEIEVNSCAECHTNVTADKIKALQKATSDRANALKARLDKAKANIDRSNDNTVKDLYTKAVYNLNLVINDKSWGIHNMPYSKALLDKVEEQIAAANKKLPKNQQI